MTIIENKHALLVTDNSKVFVLDAYTSSPQALVMDEDGRKFFVRYKDLRQEPIVETEAERWDALLREEKSLARFGRY